MPGYLLQKKILLIGVLVVALGLFFHSRTFAETNSEPMDQLQKSVDNVLEVLRSEELKAPERKAERKKRILETVDVMFDFREMARSSMGQNWNSLTEAEQDRFVSLFKELIEGRYIGKIDSYNNQTVVYKKQLIKGDRALIYTDIVDKDLEIPIIYKLEENNGKWLINDLKIENVSLIVNYRRDFDSIMRREHFEGLMKKIKEQLEKSDLQN
jgi:phospholipid transport system substrate-binding protein